jgi:hypothetical protein
MIHGGRPEAACQILVWMIGPCATQGDLGIGRIWISGSCCGLFRSILSLQTDALLGLDLLWCKFSLEAIN